MPYVDDDLDKDKDKKDGATSEDVIASGDSGGVAGASGGSGPSAQGQEGFTNINQYLDVNKQQGQGLQDKIVGDVEQKGTTAKSAIDQGEQNFGQQVQQGGYKSDDAYEQNVAKQASQVVQSPEQLQEVQKRLQGQYRGPETRDTAAETQATNQATQANQSLQSFGGRFGLLQQQFGRPDYGHGQQSLDNLLLSGSQGFGNRAQDVNQRFGNLNDVLGASAQRSGQAVGQAKADTTAAAQSLRGALQGEEGVQRAGAQQALEADQAQEAARQAQLAQLQGQPGSFDQYQSLFANPDEYSQFSKAAGATQSGQQNFDRVKQSLIDRQLSAIAPAYREQERQRMSTMSPQELQQYANFYANGYTNSTQGDKNLGNDYNALLGYLPQLQGAQGGNLANALSYSDAQNLNLAGAATPEQRAQLSALAQIQGNTDEFAGANPYQQGGAMYNEYTDFSALQNLLSGGLKGDYGNRSGGGTSFRA